MTVADPQKFQYPANARTAVTPNGAAQPDCYTDSGRTKRDVAQPRGTVPGGDKPPRTGSVLGLGNTRRFYAEDGVAEKDTA